MTPTQSILFITTGYLKPNAPSGGELMTRNAVQLGRNPHGPGRAQDDPPRGRVRASGARADQLPRRATRAPFGGPKTGEPSCYLLGTGERPAAEPRPLLLASRGTHPGQQKEGSNSPDAASAG